MGKGAESGILIKNAEALEKQNKIATLFIDKTGTLTEGKPAVTHVFAIPGYTEDAIIQYAASVENHSEHPLAKAILEETKKRSLPLLDAGEFLSIPGAGVQGNVNNKKIRLGNAPFLLKEEINNLESIRNHADFLHNLNQAQSVVYVAINEKAVGFIVISDPIKESSFEAIQELHRLGIKVVIISGDNEQTVRSVAAKLKIDDFYGDVLPNDKQLIIKNYKKQGLVAMAGDGINDAPALAKADVGIAMGTGTDVAIESADVTLVKGDLTGIVKAMHLSQAMLTNIKQNLFFAFIYNVSGIPIASGILYPLTGLLLNPMLAALAMSLSSVSVIANALRLRSKKF